MDKAELEKLKTDLRKEKEIIESELGRFTVKNPVVKGDYQSVFPKSEQGDSSDEKAHNVTEYEEERALEQNLEVRLKEISATLERIERGAYGVCEHCRTPIEPKRLQAMPAVRHCSDCAKSTQLV